jgi:formate--tetrahydrofolate ligase
VVLVATVRAMKMNGGVAKADLGAENVEAVQEGLRQPRPPHRERESFGVPVVVAINHFVTDTEAEIAGGEGLSSPSRGRGDPLQALGRGLGAKASRGDWPRRSPRCRKRAGAVRPALSRRDAAVREDRDHRQAIYRADEVIADKKIRDQLKSGKAQGYGNLPVCMAKTQYSFSTDPNLRGAPEGHSVPVREVRLSAGPGFVVVICGEIMTMPGLPRVPAAETIRLNDDGLIEGLF